MKGKWKNPLVRISVWEFKDIQHFSHIFCLESLYCYIRRFVLFFCPYCNNVREKGFLCAFLDSWLCSYSFRILIWEARITVPTTFLCRDCIYQLLIALLMYLKKNKCYYVTDYFLSVFYVLLIIFSQYNKIILVNSNENKYHLKWEAGKVCDDVLVYTAVCFTRTCASSFLPNLCDFFFFSY